MHWTTRTTPTDGLALESDNDSATGTPVDAGHTAVLYQSVLEHLAIQPDGSYLDGTIGAGGHAAGILETLSPRGQLLGLDRDPAAIAFVSERLARHKDQLILRQASFAQMGQVARAAGVAPLDGILLDLGLSSRQLDDPERGFAFQHNGPLDMRFDPGEGQSAAELVNELPVEQLAELIARYGEEQASWRIARAIVAARPVETTGDLAAVVSRTVRARERKPGIHPATRTFQALRIAVNRELDALAEALPSAVGLLRPGGRIVVIAFHSLEDRIVKQFFRRAAQDCVCPPEWPVCACDHRATLKIVTRKPIRPSVEETGENPRSRSARLRVAERV